MRKIIHIFLSLVIVYASTTSAYANTSIGGWTALDTITAGATNTINATKTAGGKALKSAITIAPQAGKVGKYLLRGGAAGALALAVPQLIGEGVDWVLDPANNRVVYTELSSGNSGSASVGGVPYVTPDSYCVAFAKANGKYNEHVFGEVRYNSVTKVTTWACGYRQPPMWFHTSGAVSGVTQGGSPVEKYMPIDTVAAKVIANAEAGHAPSQEAVKATALEGFAAGEHDAALDAAAVPDTGVENPPDTENPPVDPAAPFDPAGIISAINALKALLAGILSSIGELTGFMNSDLPPEKTQKETDVPVDDLPPTKGASDFDVNYINFGGQCPVLPSFNIGIGGASSALTFDMTPLCDMALKIRPAVIAIAYFIGLGVITSAIRET